MTQVILIFLTALIFSIVSTPIARRIALAVGVVDAPAARKVHTDPVPLLGGAAIYVAFMVGLIVLGDRAYIRELIGIMLGATLVSLFGLADDHWGLHAYLKLGGQLLAGIILLLGGTQVNLFPHHPWVNWAITLLWVVGMTNALNLLDNMDGLSGGVTTVAAAFFILLAAMGNPPQILVGAMAAALVGACVGFLRYNLNPATIFMGDTGSLFLGFVLAALGIKLRFPNNVPWTTWLVPICVLALPIFDTTLVFVSRLRRGKNPLTTPGKDHLSHRLVALGLTRREAVLTCYLIGGACGMVAIYIAQSRFPNGYVAAGLLGLAAVTSIIWLERRCPAGIPRT
ncbi:MAG: undecaprenyl/decaprenyl-phosphate alpha-N-acetylglucosaminyl 1-phosphate transferase [Chloroflexi bacterium SZAS-1]|nr:undecaprenyl/decaprenyl-phosphate alpha-N-acetylglucosaminyl 1-phosphate transferase [Chloroflexi bacterium SZAS-1]